MEPTQVLRNAANAAFARPNALAARPSTTSSSPPAPVVSLRWRPCADGVGLSVMVTQGDITTARVDAIVNAANSELSHDGGVAGAIARKGGSVINEDSRAWIQEHKRLPVGRAMVTRAGKLPCRHVIHAVGPCVGGGGFSLPTVDESQLLRDAVRSALDEAEKLQAKTVAMPGISSGIFGYPNELAAMEIVGECVRYAREKADATALETIVLVNIDSATCHCFANALRDMAEVSGRGEMPEQVLGSSLFGQADEEKTRSAVDPQGKQTAVMPIRVGENDFEFLLGVEYATAGRGVSTRCLTVLSDRDAAIKKKGQRAEETASRLLSKRVGGVVPMSDIRKAMSEAGAPLHFNAIKTTLYFAPLESDTGGGSRRSQELTQKYEQWRKKAWSSLDAPDHVVWIPLRSIKTAVAEAQSAALPRASYRNEDGKVRTPFGLFSLSASLSSLFEKHGVDVEKRLESLLLEKAIENEVQQVATLQSMTDDQLIATVLEDDWKLRLTSPPMPPPTPFELLKPDHDEYKRFVAELPSEIGGRIVSVRRIRASVRRGEYEKTKRDIKGAQTNEIEPLYHGTPERWRATAIALKGFDTNITLNGRAFGDGVYTSTNVSRAVNYMYNKGSLLRVRGFVVSECKTPGNNTIIRGDIHVFPNEKALLPLAIADYAAEDERDVVEAQQRQVQEEYAEMLRRRQEIQVDMVTQEKAFQQVMGKRLRSALQVYSSGLLKARRANQTTGRSSSRQFFQERQHFALSLPMYEVKPALVKVLRSKPIVIVVADTGSGKSTQLPQILFDEVVPASETRRIAILEPRRVNAISLSKRVSEERGLVPGQEVGYTIGRGDSNATPGVTRLEYMTHGLFVQMARDPVHLLKNYCAVIVDEAHERSVDVDLSLALIQRVLKQPPSEASASFKVVVTSATIEDEAEKFQRYLDPSLERSSIFRVHGRAFPVHVEHRDDVEMDRTALATASVGKVLTSAAIQSAMELLQTTEQGNILVFLPGEGSINEALSVARNEVGTSSTVELLDTFDAGSQGFCFRMATETSEEKEDDPEGEQKVKLTSTEWFSEGKDRNAVTTYVVGLHGKTTRAERDRVLYPRTANSRLLVFSTNIAETGVTVPNVRYVIDTGLERRVRWNATLDMNEMVTEPISKSSMIQRAGRAGRTASGICVRLYPEIPVEEFIQPDVAPAVQNAMIYKAVLLNKDLESRGDEKLEMLDPFDPSSLAQAEQRLVSLGAVDPKDGSLTPEGKALLRIGIDLRLGRFLIACARFGCLATGVNLASLLIAGDAAERLLPNRNATGPQSEQLSSLIDPSGDHLTLLNIFEAYEKATKEGRGISWCLQMGFAYDVFVDAEASREYLLKVLDSLHFPLVDVRTVTSSIEEKQTRVRCALCAAFFDQLARPRMPQTATKGFVRVLDAEMSRQVQLNATNFSSRTQGKDNDTAVHHQADTGDAREPVVQLSSSSTMWLPDISAALATTEELVVFGSLILTDSSSLCDPTISLLTHVTAADVKVAAAGWCQLVDFDALVASSARKNVVFDLADGLASSFIANGGAWLKKLQRMFGSSFVATVRNNKLYATFPQQREARIEHHLRQIVQAVAPESVVIQLADHVKMGQLIGKQGQQIAGLRDSIEKLLSSEDSGAGHEHVRSRVLAVDTTQKTVTVTLQGASKPMMSVIVGRVQAGILDILGADTRPLAVDASDPSSYQMQKCPRLAQLLNKTPPAAWNTRDDIMLQLAHALVWKGNASIHGGFLRDWVVRGEAAKDIDIQLAPPTTTETSIWQWLVKFLRECPGAAARGLTISDNYRKGVAWTLKITGRGLDPAIEVDLVDRKNLTGVAPPGVDCDAGNLLLNRTESLRKKILSAGGSLSSALDNAQRKQFVFFYPLKDSPHQAMSVQRLRKYLGRGWTCLSRVPQSVQDGLPENERQLIRPAGVVP